MLFLKPQNVASVCLLAFTIALTCGVMRLGARDIPPPGSLYREFAKHNSGNLQWRVTDHRAVEKFARAAQFLPNPLLEIEITDLQHAIRAEALIERWGGHRGTINKRVRFNHLSWITVPELEEVPEGLRPEMLMYQDNPVVEIPLDHLKEGINVFEADCDEAGGFGWGQWGLYSLVIRIYYDAGAKGEGFAIQGRISSPLAGQVITDHPQIAVEAQAPNGVARIDVLASYEGYDEDGDGLYGGWHESHFQPVRGEPIRIDDHVGTLWRQPYQIRWDTAWVPDQKPNAISLMARIQDSRGYWSVTEIVDDLSLIRYDQSVTLYPARGMTEDHGVRAGQTKSCFFDLPNDVPMDEIQQAAVHLRTWHGWDGHHEPIRVNDYRMPIDGKNHFYDYDLLPLPPSALRHGENALQIHSNTEHHQLELLWPGPALVVRHKKQDVTIETGEYQDRDHFVIQTHRACYWLDRKAGGLSRLIDRDGRDWIAFKKEPWNAYPSSAAAAFRGVPNLVHARSESGFGHPGWDVANSRQVDENTIVSTSHQRRWQLKWEFTADEAKVTVERTDGDTPYWFLYEGPVGGRWAPHQQYFATDNQPPMLKPLDYFKGEKWFGRCQWAYFGDLSQHRVLFALQQQPDNALDTFSHLGDSQRGLDSKDGMVVFGFGRGSKGIEPLLQGKHSFRIGFLEMSGHDQNGYRAITDHLSLP